MSKTLPLRSTARVEPVGVGAPQPTRTISVTGEATVREMPNWARVSLMVKSEHDTVALNAQRENARRANAVINAMKSAHTLENLATDIVVRAVHNEPTAGRARRLDHYEAITVITFETPDTTAVGSILDVAAKADGGVEIISVEYTLDEGMKHSKMVDATAQATRYAQDTVEELGRLFDSRCVGLRELTVQSSYTHQPRGMATMERVRALDAPATPAIGGPIEVTVRVLLVADVEQCNGAEKRRDTVLPPFGRAPVKLPPLGPDDF